MEVQDWLGLDVTKALIKKLHSERYDALENLITSENKEKASGIVVGITSCINMIVNLGEGDIDEFSQGD